MVFELIYPAKIYLSGYLAFYVFKSHSEIISITWNLKYMNKTLILNN